MDDSLTQAKQELETSIAEVLENLRTVRGPEFTSLVAYITDMLSFQASLVSYFNGVQKFGRAPEEATAAVRKLVDEKIETLAAAALHLKSPDSDAERTEALRQGVALAQRIVDTAYRYSKRNNLE